MFRPLLAAPIKSHDDLGKLRFPMIGSPKLDGIRVLIHPKLGPVTRKMKPVPNRHVRRTLEHVAALGHDGEIIVGPSFHTTSSAIMSHEGEPDFTYYVFDNFSAPDQPYRDRLLNLTGDNKWIIRLEQRWVGSKEDVLSLESEYLEAGYEGVMLRDPLGVYKFNRSTFKEQILLKLKTFVDMEGRVVGFEELFHNGNERQLDERGYAKHTTHQGNLVPMDTLGALVVEAERFTDVFKLGTGFTAEQRREIWLNRPTYLGKDVKFKFQDIGVKDKPRFPVFLGWRLD